MVKSTVIREALFLESVFADDLLYVDNAKKSFWQNRQYGYNTGE